MYSNNKKGVFVKTVTARKWGNSIGVSIPKKLANKYGLVNGSQIEIVDMGDGIKLKPVKDDLSFDELLSMITPENQHEEVDFGKPEGDEIW